MYDIFLKVDSLNFASYISLSAAAIIYLQKYHTSQIFALYYLQLLLSYYP